MRHPDTRLKLMMYEIKTILSGKDEESGVSWFIGQDPLDDKPHVTIRGAKFNASPREVTLRDLPEAFWTDMRSAAKLIRKQ